MPTALTLGKKSPLHEVRKAFHQTGHVALRRVELGLDQDCVRIQGVVPSYYLKQMAQVVAIKVDGINRVENDLRVAGAFSGGIR
jgi:osmotically-inducible protein OsmY